MSATQSDRETRERLLRAAEALFAERGFKAVTVREICQAAHANVAAVNYHFGDKLGLYREVIQIAIDAMRDATEAARTAGEGKQPEEQLRLYIRIFLRRLLTPGRESIHKLINREVSDPTPALDDLVEQGVRPRIEYLSSIVGRIIGCDPGDTRVLHCVVSIQAQSVMFARPNPVAARLGFASAPTAAQIEEAAGHIAEFSIAGIHGIAGRPAGVR
jgi:AcrR family transcriptional regulator